MLKSTTMLAFCLGALAAPASAGETPAHAADKAAVEAVLARYKAAIETLDSKKTEGLFAADSQVVENGKHEGSFANYLSHHLGPELAEFRSFKFSGYTLDVRVEGSLALANESYSFRVEPKTGEAIERQGVTTSVLKRVGNGWQILSMHSSSRKPRP